MRKKGRKSKGSHRRSFFPWLVAGILILLAVSGWIWISTIRHIPQTAPETEPETIPETVPEKTVSLGIVDQFYSQNPSFTDNLVEFLKEHDVTYKVHKDAEVTVKLYRNLPTFGYKLIILRVHAGILRYQQDETALFTSEEYNTYDHWTEQLLDQVGPGYTEKLEDPVFTINPKFVTECMKGNFGKATIILSSCWGLHNTHLAKAFIAKGASTFIGWDERVELEHTDRATLTLLDGLIEEELTVTEAVDKVMEEVGIDRLWRCTLKYYPHGNVRIFL